MNSGIARRLGPGDDLGIRAASSSRAEPSTWNWTGPPGGSRVFVNRALPVLRGTAGPQHEHDQRVAAVQRSAPRLVLQRVGALLDDVGLDVGNALVVEALTADLRKHADQGAVAAVWLYLRFTLSYRDVEEPWPSAGWTGKRLWLWRASTNEGES